MARRKKKQSGIVIEIPGLNKPIGFKPKTRRKMRRYVFLVCTLLVLATVHHLNPYALPGLVGLAPAEGPQKVAAQARAARNVSALTNTQTVAEEAPKEVTETAKKETPKTPVVEAKLVQQTAEKVVKKVEKTVSRAVILEDATPFFRSPDATAPMGHLSAGEQVDLHHVEGKWASIRFGDNRVWVENSRLLIDSSS